MTIEKGFVSKVEYIKHLDGDWRLVHNLWRHIRSYMTSYPAPADTTYTITEIDALFEGYSGGKAQVDAGNVVGLTQGSIPFADASGFLTEDNSNLFWDAGNVRLGVGEASPECRAHIKGATCADYSGLNPDTILLLENDDNVALQFQCATNAEARIVFADDDFNPPAGRIMYDFSGDYMDFTIGTDVLIKIEKDGADSRITSNHKGIKIDSGTYAAFIADSHDADAYFALEEDGALKWTMGFDYTDSLKFQISQGIPGASVRFEIDGGTIINLYLDVGIRDSQDLRFYDNGNYVAFKPPALGGDTTWILPDSDGDAGNVLITDGGGNLSFAAAGTGDVTATAIMTDHSIIRGNGGAKGIQDSGVLIDDADNVTGMVTLTLPNEGLHILDTNASHDLIVKAGSDLEADRILSLVTGDAARTVTLSGNPTLDDWFDQAVKQASNVSFETIGCGTITVANGNSINLQEDITFLGATTENLINFPDNLAVALAFMEAANPYMTFVSTDDSEAVKIDVKLDLIDKAIATTSKTRAYLSANQLNIDDSTLTIVQLADEHYDPGADFNVGTYSYIIPVTGYYLIKGQITYLNLIVNKRYYAYLRVDGVSKTARLIHAAIAGNLSVSINDIIFCTAGEAIQLGAYHKAGVNTVDIKGDENGWFTYLHVHLLSLD